MKRTIGLMALMLTAVAAFAQPAAARNGNDYDRKPVVVVAERGRVDHGRKHVVAVQNENLRRDAYCR